MISVEHLSIEFGARPLFSDASFVINKKDRIALVGKNGAGKSTLLKAIAGEQVPTEGNIAIQRDVALAYLPQVMKIADKCTVIEETEKAFANLKAIRDHAEALSRELSERTDYETADYMDLVERYTRADERFRMMGGADYHADMERTLQGLGFTPTDFGRPTKEFSGGWRMRIELAKLLLQRPDVLLLDEPTNHLDIESIRWLETFLARSNGAVVLVSHDRTFINNVCNRTLEIACGRITDYRVKYDDYVTLRAERREQQLRAYENQQKEIADIKDFIERFRYKPTKATQVQSRIKQLEKIVPIEVDEVETAQLHLKFPPCSRSGDFPLICEDLRKDYGDHCVFKGVNLTLRRGEKVAFVGKNGEGKSTLVKCIMDEIDYTGSLKLGAGVQIGYYAQNQAQLLDGELTVFDTIDRVARGDIRLKIRDILGAFMFGGEASDKKVKVLSGGERSRLAMIKLLLEPVNFLILDEPTNHLDMRTKDVLKEAIAAFDGTAIIVSHDRYFLDGLVDRVYAFGGGQVREHLGGIADYLTLLNNGEGTVSATTAAATTSSSATTATTATAPKVSAGRQNYEERKELARQRRKIEKEVEACEEKVTALEQQKADIEAQLSTPEGAADASLFTRHAETVEAIRQAEEAWEQALEALEALNA